MLVDYGEISVVGRPNLKFIKTGQDEVMLIDTVKLNRWSDDVGEIKLKGKQLNLKIIGVQYDLDFYTGKSDIVHNDHWIV